MGADDALFTSTFVLCLMIPFDILDLNLPLYIHFTSQIISAVYFLSFFDSKLSQIKSIFACQIRICVLLTEVVFRQLCNEILIVLFHQWDSKQRCPLCH